jgi:hypothetical protein
MPRQARPTLRCLREDLALAVPRAYTRNGLLTEPVTPSAALQPAETPKFGSNVCSCEVVTH